MIASDIIVPEHISLSKEVTRKQINTILFLGAMQVSQSIHRAALYSAA